MRNPVLTVVTMLVLAAGTFAFRFAGPALRTRIVFPPAAVKLLEAASLVLLTSLVITDGLMDGHSFAGFARPVGVAVGGLLAWRREPFLVTVLAAAAVTALLRLLGVA